MNKKTPMSLALRFVSAAWNGVCTATPHSWRVINSTMSSALRLAIEGGMSFSLGDFEAIDKRPRDGGFNFGYWAGTQREGHGECFYTSAVVAGNRSACMAFERWKNRKPFIVPGVSTGSANTPTHHKGRSRLAVGSTFLWHDKGVRVTVTSFDKDAQSLIACLYHPTTGKVAKRYKITRAMLKKEAK